MATYAPQIDRQRRRAALLGIAAGLRSQIPLAHLISALDHGTVRLDQFTLDRWLSDPRVVQAVKVSTIAELVFDKLPFIPPRTAPGPLAGRLLFGLIAGAIGARSLGGSVASGGGLGVVGSGVSAFAGTTLRRALPRLTGLPAVVVAFGEDAVAHLLAQEALSGR